MSRDILHCDRILYSQTMTLTFYTRFVDEDSAICGQAYMMQDEMIRVNRIGRSAPANAKQM